MAYNSEINLIPVQFQVSDNESSDDSRSRNVHGLAVKRLLLSSLAVLTAFAVLGIGIYAMTGAAPQCPAADARADHDGRRTMDCQGGLDEIVEEMLKFQTRLERSLEEPTVVFHNSFMEGIESKESSGAAASDESFRQDLKARTFTRESVNKWIEARQKIAPLKHICFKFHKKEVRARNGTETQTDTTKCKMVKGVTDTPANKIQVSMTSTVAPYGVVAKLVLIVRQVKSTQTQHMEGPLVEAKNDLLGVKVIVGYCYSRDSSGGYAVSQDDAKEKAFKKALAKMTTDAGLDDQNAEVCLQTAKDKYKQCQGVGGWSVKDSAWNKVMFTVEDVSSIKK